jgi:hypothetical protein
VRKKSSGLKKLTSSAQQAEQNRPLCTRLKPALAANHEKRRYSVRFSATSASCTSRGLWKSLAGGAEAREFFWRRARRDAAARVICFGAVWQP